MTVNPPTNIYVVNQSALTSADCRLLQSPADIRIHTTDSVCTHTLVELVYTLSHEKPRNSHLDAALELCCHRPFTRSTTLTNCERGIKRLLDSATDAHAALVSRQNASRKRVRYGLLV